MKDNNDKHIVFGANGALGSAIVNNLVKDGKSVIAVVRGNSSNIPKSIELLKIDCTNKEEVVLACKNVSVVYHCINVPYSKWYKTMPTVTENILEGCKSRGAKLVFPGNVYGYGQFTSAPFNEEYPKNSESKKGLLRNKMEQILVESFNKKEINLVIPRIPDLYGPSVVNALIKPIFDAAIKGKKAVWLGSLDAKHSLIYNDDAARACILLSDKNSKLEYHVSGEAITGRDFLTMVYQKTGQKLNIGVLSKSFFKFIGLFAAEPKELVDLMYEFEEPLIMDSSRFSKEFPGFSYTPHDKAIELTAKWFKS